MLFVCGSLNQAIFEGPKGFAKSLAALAAGTALMLLAIRFDFRPSTELVTSLLCMSLLLAYFLTITLDAYRRGIALRKRSMQLQHQVEEISNLQTQLHHQATHDALTGLSNRRQFDLAAEQLAIAVMRKAAPTAW